MNFNYEDITENPIVKKVSEKQLNQNYTLITPNFGTKTPCVLTPKYKPFADKIKNFKIKTDDTWLISFPKTGTTWTQEMVWLISNDLDFKGAEQDLGKRFPFLEIGGIRELPPDVDPYTQAESMKSPRFIKSHLPHSFLPTDIWNVKPKIVYVARKPKDVLVSYFYHFKMLHNYTGTLENFVEVFLADLTLYSPYHQHILDFYNLRNEKNILFLWYEDMKMDLEAQVRRTIQFFEKSFSDEDVRRLCTHLSFKSMRENKSVNLNEWKKFCLAITGREDEDHHHFIRKGQVNGWKDDLSEEIGERVDNWTKSKVEDPELRKLFL